MVNPMRQIQLLSEHQTVEYGPVPFAKKNTSLWLPKSAEIYFDFRKHHYYRHHIFYYGYILFDVEAQEKDKAPTATNDTPPKDKNFPLRAAQQDAGPKDNAKVFPSMGGMERIGARRLALTRPRHQHSGDLRAGLEVAVESSQRSQTSLSPYPRNSSPPVVGEIPNGRKQRLHSKDSPWGVVRVMRHPVNKRIQSGRRFRNKPAK